MGHQEGCPEVGVAVVAGCGVDVGYPAGGCLRQDGSDQGEALPLLRSDLESNPGC